MMKGVKYLVSLLAVMLILIALLAGCNRGGNEGAAEGEVITLRGMHWSSSTVDHLRWGRTFDMWHEINPNIVIDFEWYTTGFAERLVVLFASGDSPDFFQNGIMDLGQRIDAGMIKAITPWFEAENFDMNDLMEAGVVRYRGEVYGVLPTTQPQVLYYNRDMFIEAGLDFPNDNWTWDDLVYHSRALTLTDASGRVTQFGFQCDEFNRLWLSIFWSNGGQAFDNPDYPTQPLFNGPAGVGAAQFMLDLIVGFGVAPPPGAEGTLGYREAFTNGHVAMILDGSWMTGQFASAEDLDFGIAMVPMGSHQRGGWISPTHMSMSTQTQHPDAVWEFMKHFFGYENSLMWAGMGDMTIMNGIPVWRSAYEDERFTMTPEVEAKYRQALESNLVYSFPYVGMWFGDYINSGLQLMLIEGRDPQTVLDDIANSTINTIFPLMEEAAARR